MCNIGEWIEECAWFDEREKIQAEIANMSATLADRDSIIAAKDAEIELLKERLGWMSPVQYRLSLTA